MRKLFSGFFLPVRYDEWKNDGKGIYLVAYQTTDGKIEGHAVGIADDRKAYFSYASTLEFFLDWVPYHKHQED